MKKYQIYSLCMLSGLLLSASWFPNGIFPIAFIGFVPMLIAEDAVCTDPGRKSRALILPFYLMFFTWNNGVTWWLVNASWGGAVMAIVLNSLIMTMFFYTAHRIKRRIGKWGNAILISSWIAFEFIHLNWDLSWSWLTLGNVFADNPSIIQWYEYTGVLGGSLWVLLVNFLLFDVYKKRKAAGKLPLRSALIIAAVIVLPMSVSCLIDKPGSKVASGSSSLKTVILQPNVDPYNVKFFASYQELLEQMLKQAKTKVDSTTEYLVFPETALTEDIWEESINESYSIMTLRTFMKQYPHLKIVIGASTFKAFGPNEELSSSARKFGNADRYYDCYNTAIILENGKPLQLYHKSKLVPGAETMPLAFIFKHLESLALDMGGTVGSLGVQKERSLLYSADSSVRIAPVICYESIFGEYVGEYINKGANLIMIITNDGWWGDTPGYVQHLRYGRLRAIETRRWIVRSANTGVSCFISPAGEIIHPTGYWVPATFDGYVEVREERTFYTRCGDYIGRIALYTAIVLLIYSWLIGFGLLKKS